MYPRVKWILGFSTGLKYKILTRLSFIASTSFFLTYNTQTLKTKKIYLQSWRLLSRSFSPPVFAQNRLTYKYNNTSTITPKPTYHLSQSIHSLFILSNYFINDSVLIFLMILFFLESKFKIFFYNYLFTTKLGFPFLKNKDNSSISICGKEGSLFYCLRCKSNLHCSFEIA